MFRFSNNNTINYDDKIINDFTNQYTFNESMLNNINYFVNYVIKDGDTPDLICHKLYNDASLDWILMIVNNIVDPFFDWPLTNNELYSFCQDKYGTNNVYGTHHYELNNIVVNSTTPGSIPITNFDYESLRNDKKRNIKIPTEEFMNKFIFSYGEL